MFCLFVDPLSVTAHLVLDGLLGAKLCPAASVCALTAGNIALTTSQSFKVLALHVEIGPFHKKI